MLELLVEMTTCKLIFPVGTITEEQLANLLQKHTPHYNIANFYPEREVGCNVITFAVVDVPQKVIQKLANESIVKDIDLMAHYQTKKPSGAEECGPACSPGG